MKIIHFADEIKKNPRSQKYALVPFYKNGKPLKNAKKWGMTCLKAGTMRFRWNEENPKRAEFFDLLFNDFKIPCSGSCVGQKNTCDCKKKLVPLELIHSKIVYKIHCEKDTFQKQGDGLVTDTDFLVPSVTVGDCVPIYFYDDEKRVFAIVHSGWKGTGIIGEAVKKAVCEYGCNIKNICVAIGPHICSDCYIVDSERAEYFTQNFGSECIKIVKKEEKPEYHLSLTQANLFVLKKMGLLEENITLADDCTCCTKYDDGSFVYGSFRRQAASLPSETPPDVRSHSMTVQAAFVI